ncbi:Transcriptional regulator, padR type [Bifidobacterium breve]|nr:Transcriptional regulator, padR type [Bifidobacterium breve]
MQRGCGMAIREALLALLERGPASAYQLKKDFDRTIGLTWPLNMGQVSTTLQRLNRDGLIEETAPTTSGSNDVGTAAAAPLWRLTNSGAQELDRWWRSPHYPGTTRTRRTSDEAGRRRGNTRPRCFRTHPTPTPRFAATAARHHPTAPANTAHRTRHTSSTRPPYFHH